MQKRILYTSRKPRTEHINTIKMNGDKITIVWKDNNEIRSLEKTMRGLKKKTTSIIDGFQIFYNYIRGHMALDGLTSAEVGEIKVEGENKRLH